MTVTPLSAQVENIELPAFIVTSNLSEETQEILAHFGLEAPLKLNQYSCAVEDALIEQVQKNGELGQQVDAARDVIADLLSICQEHGIDAHAELAQLQNN